MNTQHKSKHELSITRAINAPRAVVWRCWTEGDLLKTWYCPKPWYVSRADLDVRAGGINFIVMNGPNGEENALPGQYLEVILGRRLVFTDAFAGGNTNMVWGARHWTEEDQKQHLAMGFEGGWNAAADQLNELAKSLK
jgi:uncharacterized protein YndB with AHSA1/START domain